MLAAVLFALMSLSVALPRALLDAFSSVPPLDVCATYTQACNTMLAQIGCKKNALQDGYALWHEHSCTAPNLDMFYPVCACGGGTRLVCRCISLFSFSSEFDYSGTEAEKVWDGLEAAYAKASIVPKHVSANGTVDVCGLYQDICTDTLSKVVHIIQTQT